MVLAFSSFCLKMYLKGIRRLEHVKISKAVSQIIVFIAVTGKKKSSKGNTHTHTDTCTHTHTHTHTRARARTHAHRHHSFFRSLSQSTHPPTYTHIHTPLCSLKTIIRLVPQIVHVRSRELDCPHTQQQKIQDEKKDEDKKEEANSTVFCGQRGHSSICRSLIRHLDK